jgi:hypothetical protein
MRRSARCHRLISAIVAAAFLLVQLAQVCVVVATPAPAATHTALSSECPLGATTLTYIQPALRTPDAATTNAAHLSTPGQVLLMENVVQDGFHPTDTTTGAVFTSIPSYIDSTELSSRFRIDWNSTRGSPAGACSVGNAVEDATRIQWIITVDVETPDVLSTVTIDATMNEDPAASDPAVLPSLYFAPSTASALVMGGVASTFFNLSYTCNAAGNVGIIMRLTLLAPDANGALVHSTSHTIKLSKGCAPASCAGLCLHGTCDAVTQRCVCDPYFDNDPYCSYRFSLDKTQACADEDLTLTWNATAIRATVNSAVSDWYARMGPPETCIGCPWTTELATAEYYRGMYSGETKKNACSALDVILISLCRCLLSLQVTCPSGSISTRSLPRTTSTRRVRRAR